MKPMADTVSLRVGDVVWWDDRPGWEGEVVAVHDDGTIAVQYENGESDARISPAMFTTRPSYARRP